jgi:hypothetical protein
MMKTSLKPLLAACTMALVAATSPLAMATESGAGDRGPVNQVGPQSPSDTPPGNSVNRADARRMAQDNYNAAMANCRTMTGPQRSDCRRDARATRDSALRDADNAPVSLLDAPRPAPGTTPADIGDARMAKSRTQKDAGAKP